MVTMLARYWQPLILPGRPPPDRDALIAATSPALSEATATYKPLVNHLRRRLTNARHSSMAAAIPSPGPPTTGALGP